MNKFILICFLVSRFGLSAQTCNALFSFSAYFEKAHFFNQSTVSNAHYYWNFGDGTSSYYENPVHEYPGNGTYLVTLYVFDTINNCSDHYDMWVQASKTTTDSCLPYITDSIYTFNGNDYLKIVDNSLNCEIYNKGYFSAGGNNMTNIFPLYDYPANYISWVNFVDNPLTKQFISVKTSPYKFNRSKNYQDCSANFEFKVVSETNDGQRILYSAMNKNAALYKWKITGTGDPIFSNEDTISVYYYISPNDPYFNPVPEVYLKVVGQMGCTDSLVQHASIRKQSVTQVGLTNNILEIDLRLYPNPAKNKFTLDYVSGITELEELQIKNLLGQKLYAVYNPRPKQEIDISFLPPGIYFVSARDKTAEKVLKLVKK